MACLASRVAIVSTTARAAAGPIGASEVKVGREETMPMLAYGLLHIRKLATHFVDCPKLNLPVNVNFAGLDLI